MGRVVQPGEFYRHFKNKLYQIVAIAVHSETAEPMVVYQALYGDFMVYARPLEMFLSEVDHDKYPESGQKYRFEKVDLAGTAARVEEGPMGDGQAVGEEGLRGQVQAAGAGLKGRAQPDSKEANPYLLRFLEADTIAEQLAVLSQIKGNVGQVEVDSIFHILDIPGSAGSIEEQLGAIGRVLKAKQRYDGSRLRG